MRKEAWAESEQSSRDRVAERLRVLRSDSRRVALGGTVAAAVHLFDYL